MKKNRQTGPKKRWLTLVGLGLCLLAACTSAPPTPLLPPPTTPAALPTQPAMTPAPAGDLSATRAAMAAYQPPADAGPLVSALIGEVTAWLERSNDLAALQLALDDAATLNQGPVTVTSKDLTGDHLPEVVVQIPVTGLPLLVFVDQAGAYASYALPPNYARTHTDAWPVGPGVTAWGVPQPSLELADLTGDGLPEILVTYLFPGGSGFRLEPMIFQWQPAGFRLIFAASLVNWAGEAGLALAADPAQPEARQIVLRYPFLYADGFDHKMINHPLGQQTWRWSQGAGRFAMAETSVDLANSGWGPGAPVSTADRLRWLVNQAESAYRYADYRRGLGWTNLALRVAASEKLEPGPDDPHWAAYAAFRRAAILALLREPDANPPGTYPADGLAAMQRVAADYRQDKLGELAAAFLEGYGDGSGPDAAARGVAAMGQVDLYTYFYESADRTGLLYFPMDAAGILYPGVGLAAYLDAHPHAVGDMGGLRAGLAEAGFPVVEVERSEAGAIQVTLRPPTAPNPEAGQVAWTLAPTAAGWRVVKQPHAGATTAGESSAWPVVGDFQPAPDTVKRPAALSEPVRHTPQTANAAGSPAQPFATASYLEFESWSPDGRWLAYWLSSPDDVANQLPGVMPAGSLYFGDPATGQTCAAPQFHPDPGLPASVHWGEDGAAMVVMGEEAFSGLPCQAGPFAPFAYARPQEAGGPDRAPSPDNRYWANTGLVSRENGVLTFETTLTASQDGAILQALTWQIDERLGDYGLGGAWVSPTQFLITESLSHGPVIMDIQRGMLPVLSTWLDLDEIPSILGPEGYSLRATAAPGPGTDTFHLALSGIGLEGNFPPVRLIHAHNGLVETLPYRQSWGFSADGEWLFLQAEVIASQLPAGGQNTGYDIWGRRLEDVQGAWQLVAPGVDSLLWREDGGELAFIQNETGVVWQTFPAGEWLGRWQTGGYRVQPAAFSPDGRYLAVAGGLPGQWEHALFVLPRAAPAPPQG